MPQIKTKWTAKKKWCYVIFVNI